MHTTHTLTAGASIAAVCLTGAAFASAHDSGSGYGSPSRSGSTAARQVAGSGGVRFLRTGQTVRLGKVGHFTLSAGCMMDDTGENAVTFDVTADTTAALDGNAPAPAGTKVNIHTNSDALDEKSPGEFDQVGSASSSTLLAKDGQEVDIFYNDGVNWPAVAGSPAHACFAGYTGIRG
jgi:hypothetical protein